MLSKLFNILAFVLALALILFLLPTLLKVAFYLICFSVIANFLCYAFNFTVKRDGSVQYEFHTA